MIGRLLVRLAARSLGRRSHRNMMTAQERIRERTRQMREQLGLPADRRLA